MPSDRCEASSYFCDGGCGEGVVVKAHRRLKTGELHGLLEALGYTTRDKGRKTLVFCEHCQAQARLIGDPRRSDADEIRN